MIASTHLSEKSPRSQALHFLVFKYMALIILSVFPFFLNGQICDNPIPTSGLIVNGDFEENNGDLGESLNTGNVPAWGDIYRGTPDYYHVDGDDQGGPSPNQSDAWVRTTLGDQDGFLEMIATCLNEPLVAGTPYTLSLYLGSLNEGPVNNYVLELYLIGLPTCDPDINPDNGQRPDEIDFLQRIEVNMTINQWLPEKVNLSFTPDQDYPAILIGGVSATARGEGLLIDEVSIEPDLPQNEITQEGVLCDGTLNLGIEPLPTCTPPVLSAGYTAVVYDAPDGENVEVVDNLNSSATFPNGTPFTEVATFDYLENAGTENGLDLDFRVDTYQQLRANYHQNNDHPDIDNFTITNGNGVENGDGWGIMFSRVITEEEAGIYEFYKFRIDNNLFIYLNNEEIELDFIGGGFTPDGELILTLELNAGDLIQFFIMERHENNTILELELARISDTNGNPVETCPPGGGITYAYQWYRNGQVIPAATETTYNVPSDQPGTYSMLITSSDGRCQIHGPLEIPVEDCCPIEVNAGEDITITEGESTNLSATVTDPVGQATYSWAPATGLSNPTIPNPVAQPTQTTQYILTVTDERNCVDIDTVLIVAEPLVCQVEASPDTTICLGESVLLSVITQNTLGEVTYLWTPGSGLDDPTSATPTASPTETTMYTLTITDENGCDAQAQVEVGILPLPELTDLTPTVCVENAETQDLGALIPQITQEVGNISFFRADNTPILDPTEVSVVDGEVITVSFINDITACQSSSTITYTVVPQLNLSMGEDLTVCLGEQAQLLVSGAVTYLWNPDVSLSATDVPNPIITPLQSTTYFLTGTDAEGCTGTDSIFVEVTIPQQLSIMGANLLCEGDSVLLNASLGTELSWAPEDIINVVNDSTAWITPEESTTITLSALDDNGCQIAATYALEVEEAPTLEVGNDLSTCEGTSVQLLATSNASQISWFPQTGLDDPSTLQPFASPTVPTTYFIQASNGTNCVATDSIKVTPILKPTLSLSGTDLICEGQIATLISATSPANEVIWNTGEISREISLSPSLPTQLWALALSPEGCVSDTAYGSLEVLPTPESAFRVDTTLGFDALEVTFSNQSSDASEYYWDFGDGNTSAEENPIHRYTRRGEYKVSLVASSEGLCADTVSFESIEILGSQVFLPSGFSPNSDDINDEFFLEAPGFDALTYQIFDQWGRLVFEGVSAETRWDGTLNGTPVQEGTYMIKVEVTSFRGNKLYTAGTLTLFR